MKFNKHQLRQISPYLLIGAFYIVAVFVIGIGGDFPLNDDWAYAEGVRHLLQGEGLIMPNVCAAGIAHVALGFIAVKLLGYSYVGLRFCSFLITILGAVAMFVAAASLRIPRTQAAFLTLLYAANPILLNLAFGFMSDSTALALNMIFLAGLIRGLAKKSLPTTALAFLILALAVSVRQSALIFLILSPFCLSKRFGEGKSKFVVFAMAVLLPLLSAWACDQWLLASYASSGSTNIGYDLVRKAHSSILQKCFFSPQVLFLPAISAAGQVFCYLALFCLPALLALVPMAFARPKNAVISPKLTLVLAFVILASALVTVALYHQTMPFSENILRATTLGAQGLLGIIRQPISQKGRMILTIVSFIAAMPLAVSFCYLGQECLKKTRSWRSVMLAASVSVSLLFLVLETIVRCTDRYYLIALGPTLLAIGFIAKNIRLSLVQPISICLLLAIGWYSICGNQEYLSSSRARWQAIQWLERRGVKSQVVDGGYEYNTLRDISIYNTTYRGEAPRNTWRWWPIRGEAYLISLSPVPGYESIHEESYYSLFDRKTRSVAVLEKIGIAH